MRYFFAFLTEIHKKIRKKLLWDLREQLSAVGYIVKSVAVKYLADFLEAFYTLLVIGYDLLHHSPELLAVIHIAGMAQLMYYYIVDKLLRCGYQLP